MDLSLRLVFNLTNLESKGTYPIQYGRPPHEYSLHKKVLHSMTILCQLASYRHSSVNTRNCRSSLVRISKIDVHCFVELFNRLFCNML